MKERKAWVEEELSGCEFGDVRLHKRFYKFLENSAESIGGSIPFASQDWSSTKAAYRFLSNDRVSEKEILEGHFRSTRERCNDEEGPILILHDTTEFSFKRKEAATVGLTRLAVAGKYSDGRLRYYTASGILMHSSLVITTEGLPLGLASIKFWNRKKFKGCNALKKKINPTRIPIEQKESFRWLENLKQSNALLAEPENCVHIGDRESDIYELFCLADRLGTNFLIRSCVDRLAIEGDHTIRDVMKNSAVTGTHQIKVRDEKGNLSKVSIEVKYRHIRVLPPIGKNKKYPELNLTIIHAQEKGTPKNRKRIDWKLITNLPVKTNSDAIQKLQWYALRWKIEVFHKILKSGCKVEESKLRTAERLVNLISIYCILSWRIFWMTIINRSTNNVPPDIGLTQTEIHVLDELIKDKSYDREQNKILTNYITKIARLGGYQARSSDPPPGNMVIWRGLSRLTDITLGYNLGKDTCG
ncbi:IS4 family transposase [Leptospira weilii]|uniref:IS4 family transposase n=1 Tax=Leptospira weilii TaxID=28184 RepID=UPI000773F309|nr:IS4 family transposase [Leptospira weilii]